MYDLHSMRGREGEGGREGSQEDEKPMGTTIGCVKTLAMPPQHKAMCFVKKGEIQDVLEQLRDEEIVDVSRPYGIEDGRHCRVWGLVKAWDEEGRRFWNGTHLPKAEVDLEAWSHLKGG